MNQVEITIYTTGGNKPLTIKLSRQNADAFETSVQAGGDFVYTEERGKYVVRGPFVAAYFITNEETLQKEQTATTVTGLY